MTEILAAALTLPTLGTALLVWGLAPGFVNRLFARLYPMRDERRREMVAELYAVPRWEQPFWVAQQAERAISEGLPARLHQREERRRLASGRTGAYFATTRHRVMASFDANGRLRVEARTLTGETTTVLQLDEPDSLLKIELDDNLHVLIAADKTTGTIRMRPVRGTGEVGIA